MTGNTMTAGQLQEALLHVCDVIIDSEQMLTQLDTIIGDGDHGIGMKTGFLALRAMLRKQQFTDAYTLMKESGMTLIKVMGGTSGVIYGTLFIGGLSALEGKDPISEKRIFCPSLWLNGTSFTPVVTRALVWE